MPGFIMHLTEAQMILRRLEKEGFFASFTPEQKCRWMQLFELGALLPDTAADQEEKNRTHYRNPKELDRVVVAPDLQLFLEKYQPEAGKADLCGCYAHLLLDHAYFTEFFPQHVQFLDEAGEATDKLKKARSVRIRKSGALTAMSDFFSEKWLYGNYTKLNDELVERYDLKYPAYIENHDNPVTESDWNALPDLMLRLQEILRRRGTDRIQGEVFDIDTISAFLEESSEAFLRILNAKTGRRQQ